MLQKIGNYWNIFTSHFALPANKKTISFLALAVIAIALPVTVLIAQQQQSIRQRAAELLSPPFPTPTPKPLLPCGPWGYGDINQDGSVNSADALLASRFAIDKITPNPQQKVRADVNGDNTIDSADLLLIKKYAVGTITTFPVCSSPTPAPASKLSPCKPYGDVDLDGMLSGNDSSMILRYLIGALTLTQQQKANAEVNGDGILDSADALTINNYLAGTATTFPICAPTTVKPSISIISPIGGEQWPLGSTHRISWKSTGVISVIVYLINDTTGSQMTIYTGRETNYNFDWGISPNGSIAAGNKYKIVVKAAEGVASAESNYFSIVARYTVPKPSPCKPYGDVDGDGSVSSNDVTMIAKYEVGAITLTQQQKFNGDVNGDGRVDVGDRLIIQRYLEGTLSTFPICSINPTPIPRATCSDTDGGRNYYVAGSLFYTNNPYGVLQENDSCDGSAVIEGVCNSQTQYMQNHERYTCPFGCSSGRCNSTPTPTPVPAAAPATSTSDFCSNACVADINKDGVVNYNDWNTIVSPQCWAKPATGTCLNADLDKNGVVNSIDLNCVIKNYQKKCP